MIVCAAQLRPCATDVLANIDKHLALIDLAVKAGANLVLFPELSLTGYEPRHAQGLASHIGDPRLQVFQQRSDQHQLWISVGMPIASPAGVRIESIWFSPKQARRSYAKQMLHTDELPFFVPGQGHLVLSVGTYRMACAICYESLQMVHAQATAALGANVYLASVAKSANGVRKAFDHYPKVAQSHHMAVLMANSVGPSDDFVSAGQSAAWNAQGQLLAHMDEHAEGVLVFDCSEQEAHIHLLAA